MELSFPTDTKMYAIANYAPFTRKPASTGRLKIRTKTPQSGGFENVGL
jgi:hypothetical protein